MFYLVGIVPNNFNTTNKLTNFNITTAIVLLVYNWVYDEDCNLKIELRQLIFIYVVIK